MIAGVAAGISAVFRTPLGAALLAVEVLYRDDFESDALIPAVFASVVAYSVVISIFGESTLIAQPRRFPFVPSHLPLYALMAVLVALVANLFLARCGWCRRCPRRARAPVGHARHRRPRAGRVRGAAHPGHRLAGRTARPGRRPARRRIRRGPGRHQRRDVAAARVARRRVAGRAVRRQAARVVADDRHRRQRRGLRAVAGDRGSARRRVRPRGADSDARPAHRPGRLRAGRRWGPSTVGWRTCRSAR